MKKIWIVLLCSMLMTGCNDDLPGPDLSDLSVAGGKTALTPSFSKDITRYSVADDGTDGIVISATAFPNLTIEVNGQLIHDQVELSGLSAFEEITVSVTDLYGKQSDYDIVYLPSTFPELKVTTKTSGVSEGLIYMAFIGANNFLVAIDQNGVPAFARLVDNRAFNFRQAPNGQYTYSINTGVRTQFDENNFVNVILDEQFNEIEQLTMVNLEQTDLHEFFIRPNGTRVMMSYEGIMRDVTDMGGPADTLVFDSIIQEVDEAGQLLFEWNSWGDVLYEEELRDNPDYAHVNSVFIDPIDGHYIISARGTSQVVKVDSATSELLWKWGGISNQFTFINDPFSHLCGQHTVSRLANGNYLMFDNGQFCYPESSERGLLTRVVEYKLDESAMTAELVWDYIHEFAYSRAAGSTQRLANGNTLVGWGISDDGILATEVDADGNKVFELTGTLNGNNGVRSYRALKF